LDGFFIISLWYLVWDNVIFQLHLKFGDESSFLIKEINTYQYIYSYFSNKEKKAINCNL